MIVTQEVHRDRYGLVIVEIGPNFAKVFCEVKTITGKTTMEVSILLKSRRPTVLIASKRELGMLSIKLTKVGAKVDFELMD
ncbi:hypothetical protein [Massilia genomosp. 1]|uniref:Uncharacterized protein n=1 Tax=Massilia genomosp. 1 TaxID=2609280 RepID=A0ABX0MRM5_9BURK|nr:hypothetical protein [Massilia genomosp. 1]NHZ63250.1 hypothetical protein [Massilia genomosp. 1]